MRDIVFTEMEPLADLLQRNNAIAFSNNFENPWQYASAVAIAYIAGIPMDQMQKLYDVSVRNGHAFLGP